MARRSIWNTYGDYIAMNSLLTCVRGSVMIRWIADCLLGILCTLWDGSWVITHCTRMCSYYCWLHYSHLCWQLESLLLFLIFCYLCCHEPLTCKYPQWYVKYHFVVCTTTDVIKLVSLSVTVFLRVSRSTITCSITRVVVSSVEDSLCWGGRIVVWPLGEKDRSVVGGGGLWLLGF
jgi:hypothetical protein